MNNNKRFEAEGAKPFQYRTRTKTVTVASYWQLPERLYDDPHELSDWAREAFTAAQRAALNKRPRHARRKVGQKPGKKAGDSTARKATNKAKKPAVKKRPKVPKRKASA